MNKWYVYLVRCSDQSLYCGVAKDLQKRIQVHNSGRGAKYTRVRLPVKLVYYEGCKSLGDALRLEYRIKHLSKQEKERLVK
jgi:predicted GIY-YIG superfamily endonuclease